MKTFNWFLVISAVIIAVALRPQTDAQPSISGPQIYNDHDACDVYSAVLPMDSWNWQSSKSLLILREIPPSEWPIGSPRSALHGTAEFGKAFADVFKSFEEANQHAMLFDCALSIQKPYKVISKSELDGAFHHPPPNAVQDGWEGFRDNFPDSNGFLILSAVGFNSDRSIALVYIEYRCGNMCGASRYYVLKKRAGQWVKFNPQGLKSETIGYS